MARDRGRTSEVSNRSEGRGRGRTSESANQSSSSGITRLPFAPVDFTPERAQSYGGFSGGESLRVVDAWWEPMFFGDYRRPEDNWQVVKGLAEPNTLVGALARHIVYEDVTTGEQFEDSFAALPLEAYVPAEKDDQGIFCAGGYSVEDYLDIAYGRVETIAEGMRGTFIGPVPQEGAGRKTQEENDKRSNAYFYDKTLEESAKANGIKIPFGPDLTAWLVGVEGTVQKMTNTLAPTKKKPEINVFTVVERWNGSGKAQSQSTRAGGRSASTTAPASTQRQPTTSTATPATGRGRGRNKHVEVTEGDLDFLEDFVSSFVAKHGAMSRTDLMKKAVSDDALNGKQQQFFEVVDPGKSDYIDNFWAASDKWIWEQDTDTVSPFEG